MQFVTEAPWPPRACIVTGFGVTMTSKGRLLDTMNTTQTGERIYLSDDAINQVAALFDYAPRTELDETAEALEAAMARIDELEAQLKETADKLAAIDFIESAGFTARKKTGRPKKKPEEVAA